LLAFFQIAMRIHDDAAGDRAVRAGVARLRTARELERADGGRVGGLSLAEAKRPEACAGDTRPGARQEVASRELHVHVDDSSSGVRPLRGTRPKRQRSSCSLGSTGIRDKKIVLSDYNLVKQIRATLKSTGPHTQVYVQRSNRRVAIFP